jgi:hypothetical protein
MSKLPGGVCRHQTPDAPERRSVTRIQLIAIVTLALSTLIAATAVSFGLARAGGLCPGVAVLTAPFTVA